MTSISLKISNAEPTLVIVAELVLVANGGVLILSSSVYPINAFHLFSPVASSSCALIDAN